MSLIKMPEGVELDLKVYVVGLVENVETEIVITVSGLPVFSDEVRSYVDLDRIIESQRLNELGSDWRVMNRAEIADYKQREAA